MATFTRRSSFGVDAQELFRWHQRPGALERLTPPFEPVEVLEASSGPDGEPLGARLRVHVGPLSVAWDAEHVPVDDPLTFRDRQVRGPFASWVHTHRVRAAEGGSELEDSIEYRLPGGPLGRLGAGFVRNKLARVFDYRHRVLQDDFSCRSQTPPGASMKILLSGASGLVGSSLAPYLTSSGHEVRQLVRREPRAEDELSWDPAAGRLDASALEGLDAVVHLGGANIGEGRWTDERKKLLASSRIDSTRLLAETLAELEAPPKVLVLASAVGFYGDRGEEVLDESSAPGTGFLAELCRDWERAADPAREAGMRVVHLRFGVVLSPAGGALARMLTPFKLGLGGKIGSGRQYFPWIAIDDASRAILHAVETESLAGPVNAVAPELVTNAELTRALGRVLKRPTLFPMPAFAAKLAFGEMGEALLLAGQRVRPKALEASGFRWGTPDLEDALRLVLGRPK